jgi:type I restriction enzyme M protein
MSKEQDQEKDIPPQYWWDELLKKEGEDLKEFYKQMLLDLGNPEKS